MIPAEERKHLPVLREKEDPPVSIRMSGTALTEAGNLTQHKYFEFLNMDLEEYDIEMTPDEAKRVRGSLAKMSTGSSSMSPQVCSPRCPWKDRCVFFKMNRAPFGLACIVEVNLLREWTTSYFEEYKVDPNNFTEITMISEMAEIDILLWRINQMMALPEHVAMLMDQTIALAHDGTPITQTQVSPLLEVKERLSARKTKLIKLMVGDRQEKYKRDAALKRSDDTDPSSMMADLRNKLERLARDVKAKEIKSIDVEVLSPEDVISE